MTAQSVLSELKHLANPEKAIGVARFFKTGPGQYGEGDQFLGITVPEQRKVAKQFAGLPLGELTKLLQSPIHEARLTALLIMVGQYKKGSVEVRQSLYDVYLANTAFINNWDLVDSSAEYIVGSHIGADLSVLKRLAKSDSLWERRIAMLSCFHFIKMGDSAPAFVIIELLKHDKHDLIHKAVGWMLREIGEKCSDDELRLWLQKDDNYMKIPRTMLRYAIEHFSPEVRKGYLKGMAKV